jgi:hypothetical protein
MQRATDVSKTKILTFDERASARRLQFVIVR